ncbi:MAG: hypothetical protein K1X28_05315 [Parachlamydiales bacterium]|nr:hypothetical protein [Parachlamydiales bacterium]
MVCRYSQLEETMNGLAETGVPLVGMVNNQLSLGGYSDDLGIYYFIPMIAKFFGISLDVAIPVFLFSLLILGALSSCYCFFKIFNNWLIRSISVIGIIFLTLLGIKFYDVYIAGLVAVEITLPLLLLWKHMGHKLNFGFLTILAFIGIFSGYSNFIRCHAGTGCLLLVLTWILLSKDIKPVQKSFCIILVSAFFLIPYLHFRSLEYKRDQYLLEKGYSYQKQSLKHPKWHNIYIGFGYLKNNLGISYDDSVSFKKAKSVKADVVIYSDEYESILRNECISLVKSDLLFVIKTVFAKILFLFISVLMLINVGIVACFYVQPSFRFVMPMLIASAFYAIPGVVTMPIRAYVSGMAAIAVIFGIYMICLGLEKFWKLQPGVEKIRYS